MKQTETGTPEWSTRAARLVDAQREYAEVMTTPGPDPVYAYYDGGVVGFVFAEMWPRAALSRYDRRWVTLACVAAAGAVIPIQTHVYAALNSGDCTLEEIDEFNLHVATQLGWPRGQVVNMHVIEATKRIASERGEPERVPQVLPWADPATLAERVARGRAAYEEIMLAPAPEATTVFRRVGYLAYLYGEIWTRGGLSRRARRIVSICCAAHDARAELDVHLDAALASKDLTYEELQEVVLHYAVYLGWMSGAILDDALVAAHARHLDRTRA
jgi:4-carboxymuconolactone decarboxylase